MKNILIITFFFQLLLAYAQNKNCGTDEMYRTLFIEHPELNQGIIHANEQLENFTKHFIQNPTKSNASYIIPVVFHVIHNGGIENISDEQIKDAIKQVNIQFRKLNSDTNEIIAPFLALASDASVELRLAQLDPNGNCTSGITRTQSYLTSVGDHQVKSLIHWPPNQYLNVYICKEASGLAGHALLPSAADTIPSWDGIVMQHDYIGTIGTSDYFRRTVLSHEIGHFLNLQHIWGGNNVPNYYYLPVGQSSNCGFDDEVSDTPNSIGWSSCNLSANSCGELENVQNYMDYAYCARMFTHGQVLRMHAALNSSVANRNNLWTASNLALTGTNDLQNHFCEAAVSVDLKNSCSGDSLHFIDVSFHGITNRLWTFEGGFPATSNLVNPAVFYPNSGNFDVTLMVTNGIDSITNTFQNYISIYDEISQVEGVTEDFENDAHILNYFNTDPAENNEWELGIGYQSDQSYYYNNFSKTGKTVAIQTVPMDLTNTSNLAISFDWAHARRTIGAVENLKIYMTTNCGKSWQLRKTYTNTQLNSTDSIYETPFFPNSEEDWNHDTIFIVSPTLLNANAMVRFEFAGTEGNNFFLDNIRIGDFESLSIEKLENEISIFPNPSNEFLYVETEINIENVEIAAIDYLGNKWKLKSELNGETSKFDLKDLSSGVYFLEFHTNQGVLRKQFSIVK